MKYRVQIIEDDESIATLLAFNLNKEGYEVLHADNGEDGLMDIQSHRPDLVLVDWMLPDMSGIDVTRQLRFDGTTKDLPIIMLTARGTEDDRIRGLDVGADDYVTKPFSMRELQSRIKAQLRKNTGGDRRIFGDITVDIGEMRVTRGKREIKLSPKEFSILTLITSKPGRVYTREMILDQIWGLDDDVEIRTVDVVVGRLRRALKRGKENDPIRTIRGSGYSWDA